METNILNLEWLNIRESLTPPWTTRSSLRGPLGLDRRPVAPPVPAHRNRQIRAARGLPRNPRRPTVRRPRIDLISCLDGALRAGPSDLR